MLPQEWWDAKAPGHTKTRLHYVTKYEQKFREAWAAGKGSKELSKLRRKYKNKLDRASKEPLVGDLLV